MGEFSGKIAIVMGASTKGGMGEATAKRLAKEGATVVVSGLGKDNLEALAKEIGGAAFEADITKEAEVKALVDFAADTYGGLHIAVNHAGLSDRCSIRDFTEEHLLKMTKINYFGTVWFIKQVAERIVDYGAIVTTSSLSAWDTLSGITAYAAAKRAADRFVQAAAVEYREKRLRINAIIPSTNDTNMLRKGLDEYGYDFDTFTKPFIDLTPLGRLSRPEDIAGMVYMMVRDEFFETGQIWNYSGGNSLLGHPRTLA
ncbi:MAG: SDR family NAD(P)-dependent oxidoreductase [Sphingobium phenoxybenzoativorans]|uniref:SDR family oxidoreductase n=1 Tax=Sphingobium phenoxybenzoativorans TaxID=1592790 RepID=A0A975K931_9SPHN|nr:SDR family oxidoreductase [Sphingobium phenoxybenzoativorans]QUT06737.1 SDR family oxidoreductase [Sphingobium phenoxybenzoativorans]